MVSSVGASDDVRAPQKGSAYIPGLLYIIERSTHERDSTVSTPTDLWLIDVDKDPWMTQRSASSITRDSPRFRPSYRLLVNEANGSFRLWLIVALVSQLHISGSTGFPRSRSLSFLHLVISSTKFP